MRQVASANDAVFAERQTPGDLDATAPNVNLWANAYGGSGMAGTANVCMLRYRQVHKRRYIDDADR
jgi:hypothetical protein